MDHPQRRRVGFYFEEWLLAGQAPVYLCTVCASKKTFRSIKSHERWGKHKERVAEYENNLTAAGTSRVGCDIRQAAVDSAFTQSENVVGWADVLARLDAGLGNNLHNQYNENLDWRSTNGDVEDTLDIPKIVNTKSDDHFSEFDLNELAEIVSSF